MTVLNLVLKKEWFDMIKSGEKKEEYREIKDYWARRFVLPQGYIEACVWDEFVNDLKKPYHRHNGPEELFDYFNVFFKDFQAVRLRHGYAKNAPEIIKEIDTIMIDTGRVKWGAKPLVYYFVIKFKDLDRKNAREDQARAFGTKHNGEENYR